MRPRNPALERYLTQLAADAAGFPAPDGELSAPAAGLRAFADRRALPGGVREDADWNREAAEEIADLANYLVWGLIDVHDRYMVGESEAGELFARRMRALVHTVQAWAALQGA